MEIALVNPLPSKTDSVDGVIPEQSRAGYWLEGRLKITRGEGKPEDD